MKRIILCITIIFTLFLFSCEENNSEPPTPPIEETEYITLTFIDGENSKELEIIKGTSLELSPSLFIKEDYNLIGWSIEESSNELFDFATKIFQNTKFYAVWESKYKDYSYLLDELLDEEIYDSLELPTFVDDAMLSWSSSDRLLFSTEGKVINPRVDTPIEVYLDVFENGHTTRYQKEIIIKAINFEPLKESGLVFGYYSTWGFFGYNDVISSTIDVANICFSYVDSNFELTMTGLNANLDSILAARKKGIRVVLSVQGYSSGGINFSRAASTEANRKKLANSMLNILETYYFDGIDIDWEYPGFNTGTSTAIDRANYTLLMEEIYKTLKAKDPTYLLTAAIPGGGGSSRFDLGNVSKYLDYIHIMTYDLQNGSRATHHTALHDSAYTLSGCSVESSVRTYVNAGVDPKKIAVGVAFYGRRAKSTDLGASASGYQSITYMRIKSDYLSRLNNGVTYGFDSVAYAPYLLDIENGYYITYDDEVSIKGKCKFANDNNLAGVMIWELAEDKTCTLLLAIREEMKENK